MRYLSEDQAAPMMGLGYFGDVYEGLDGHLYEWVDGVDQWGDPIGFWQGLSQPEVPALGGLGALYAAPDGTLYGVQGLAEEEEAAEEPKQSGESEAPPAMGPGRPGEIRAGPDGKRYRWVQGLDAQGKRTGFWRRLRPRAPGQPRPAGRPAQRPGPGGRPGPPRKGGFLRKLLPVAKFATRFIPGVGPVVSAGLDVASKLAKRKGVAGYDGLGALYAAPDGTVFAVQGLLEEDLDGLYADEELRGFAEDEALRGFADDQELRGLYADEEPHQRRPPGRRPPRKGGFLRKLLPVAKFLIPGAAAVSAGLRVASKLAKRKGVAGYDGLGALYAAPDGTVYKVAGLMEADLDGLYADEELRGFAEDEALRGFADDQELRGLYADEELRGFAEDEALRGFADDQELRGLDQGYVREGTVSGLDAYVRTEPARTRWFAAPDEPPEVWKPLW